MVTNKTNRMKAYGDRRTRPSSLEQGMGRDLFPVSDEPQNAALEGMIGVRYGSDGKMYLRPYDSEEHAVANVDSMPVYSVSDYGIDQNAIQAAIDEANDAGGGAVSLESGRIYEVAFTDGVALIIYPNIEIIGNNATIKVSNGAGNYESIMSSVPDTADLSNLKIHGVNFDHNSANNSVTVASQLIGNPRMAIRCYGGDNIKIRDNRFFDVQSTNTVSCNGANMRGVEISGNRFYDVGGSTVDFDHSTIYVHAKSAIITSNSFEATSENANGARTAIETHGSGSVVFGNDVEFYRNGVIGTGVYSDDTIGYACFGNTLRNVEHGVVLYSLQYGSHTTGYGIDGANIFGNTIKLIDPANLTAGISPSGIVINAGANLPIRNLNICDNIIDAPISVSSRLPGISSIGIGVVGNPAAGGEEFENITISGNTITNIELSGIRFTCYSIKNMLIQNNMILNPGSTVYGSANVAYKAGIHIWATNISGLYTKSNVIIDNLDTSRISYGIYANGTGDVENINMIDDAIETTGSTTTSLLYQVHPATISIVPFIRAKYDTWIRPILWFQKGSTITETGINFVHTNYDGASQWISQGYGSAAPVSGTWNRGSRVLHTGPSAGGFEGWVCVAGGTPGTWKQFGTIAL